MPICYQFYFLFRISRWKESLQISEPENIIEQVTDFVVHDENVDKRVFHYALSCEEALDSQTLNQKLVALWHQLKSLYAHCRVSDLEQGKVETDVDKAEDLFLGVSVVIVGAQITDPKWSLPILDHQEQKIGDLPFKQQKPLFKVYQEKQALIEFFEWTGWPRYDTPQRPKKHPVYQLHFTEAAACLSPLLTEEHQNHPLCFIYSLQTGSLIEADLKPFLQRERNSQGKIQTVLFKILPTLFICHWQSAHIVAAALQLMDRLQSHNAGYRQIADETLRCQNEERLYDTLQTMRRLEAETQYMQARIEQATATLETNQVNLEAHLHSIQTRLEKNGWTIQFTDRLSQIFNKNIITLNSRAVYLSGLLAHLQASAMRWQTRLDRQRSRVQSRLEKMTMGVFVLAAFFTVIPVLKDSEYVASTFIFYIIIVLLSLFMASVIWEGLKVFKEKGKCWWKKWRGL